jgi:hypothetical protein
VTRTTSQSDSTRVPPVTALRSPPLSRMTGALSPVMALSSTEATPSTISPSPGMSSPGLDQHDGLPRAARTLGTCWRARLIDAPRRAAQAGDVLTRLAQRVGLRLAAALGHGLGEVGEEHGEPQPERDGRMKPGVPRPRR